MIISEIRGLDHLTTKQTRLEGDLTEEQKTFYDEWEVRDHDVRFTLLSMLEDEILYRFDHLETAKDLWDGLKATFGVYTIAQKRSLNIALDSYKMNPKHTMKDHVMHVCNLIADLKEAGENLSEEQQINYMIRSLPDSWNIMKMSLTHVGSRWNSGTDLDGNPGSFAPRNPARGDRPGGDPESLSDA